MLPLIVLSVVLLAVAIFALENAQAVTVGSFSGSSSPPWPSSPSPPRRPVC